MLKILFGWLKNFMNIQVLQMLHKLCLFQMVMLQVIMYHTIKHYGKLVMIQQHILMIQELFYLRNMLQESMIGMILDL